MCVFWELKVALNSLNIAVRFDVKDVLFGILDTDNINTLVNHILLESKYFIYRCKLKKDSFCIRLLVDPDSKRRFEPNVISRNKTTKSIFILYNSPSYSRILIGSCRRSIKGQIQDCRHHHKVFSFWILKWRKVLRNKIIFYVTGWRKSTKTSCRGIKQVREARKSKKKPFLF